MPHQPADDSPPPPECTRCTLVNHTASWFVLGCGASALGVTTVRPYERWRWLTNNTCRVDPMTHAQHRWFLLKSELRHPSKLWIGNTQVIGRTCPQQGLAFMLKNLYAEYLIQPSPPPRSSQSAVRSSSLASHTLAGAAAGATQRLFLQPVLMARNEIVSDFHRRPRFTGVFNCIVQTARTSGIKAIYENAFVVTSAYAAVYHGAYFGLYDTFSQSESILRHGLAGKVALALGGTLTADVLARPLVAIRNAMWMKDGPMRTAQEATREIIAKGGLRAFYKGFRCHSTAGAIALVAFDYGRAALLA